MSGGIKNNVEHRHQNRIDHSLQGEEEKVILGAYILSYQRVQTGRKHIKPDQKYIPGKGNAVSLQNQIGDEKERHQQHKASAENQEAGGEYLLLQGAVPLHCQPEQPFGQSQRRKRDQQFRRLGH